MTFTDGNAKQVTEDQGLQAVCEALSCHDDCSELVESACAAILSLCMEGRIILKEIMLI